METKEIIRENNQYKGFAYKKENSKSTAVYGASTENILAELNAYNVVNTDQDQFRTCNIGKLNTETNKYEDYHKYDVATGKDISPVYLQIPYLEKDEFQKVVADLKAAGARFNPNKREWYITSDQAENLQKYQDICDQFSGKKDEKSMQISVPDEDRVPFRIEEIDLQYAIKLDNQQTVVLSDHDLRMLQVKPDALHDFFGRMNEKVLEQLQQLSNNPEQVAAESEYTISVSKDAADNSCTVWFNDGREQLDLQGDTYGVHFPTMGQAEAAEFVAEYLRRQEYPELNMQAEFSAGDRIDCYVPLRLQDNDAIRADQALYVENIRHIVGTVQTVRPVVQADGVVTGEYEYTVLDDDRNTRIIHSDEIYAPDQVRVLLRAAADELTGVQFDLLADKRLSAAQMEEIRFGFKDRLKVEQVALYANPEMTPAEMDLCRIALTNGLNYSEISSLLKETKELSWTDSRNRLNEVIKENRQRTLEKPDREEKKEEPAASKEVLDRTETADIHEKAKAASESQEGADIMQQFVAFMGQQNMRESAENFMAVFQSVIDMQVQMELMKQELNHTREEYGKLLNNGKRFENQYKGLMGFTEDMREGMRGISESLTESKNQLLQTAKQSVQAFKEKGRQGVERVLQKGIIAVKKKLVSCKERMMSTYKAYENVADRIDRTGNELKQIGNDFVNVGRALSGKQKKEVEAPDQGVALTRVINAPVKKHMESLKKHMSKIDQIFERLDRVSESLSKNNREATNEKQSVVGKLSHMKEKAEEQHNEQPKLQKEKTQETCL